LVYSKSE